MQTSKLDIWLKSKKDIRELTEQEAQEFGVGATVEELLSYVKNDVARLKLVDALLKHNQNLPINDAEAFAGSLITVYENIKGYSQSEDALSSVLEECIKRIQGLDKAIKDKFLRHILSGQKNNEILLNEVSKAGFTIPNTALAVDDMLRCVIQSTAAAALQLIDALIKGNSNLGIQKLDEVINQIAAVMASGGSNITEIGQKLYSTCVSHISKEKLEALKFSSELYISLHLINSPESIKLANELLDQHLNGAEPTKEFNTALFSEACERGANSDLILKLCKMGKLEVSVDNWVKLLTAVAYNNTIWDPVAAASNLSDDTKFDIITKLCERELTGIYQKPEDLEPYNFYNLVWILEKFDFKYKKDGDTILHSVACKGKDYLYKVVEKVAYSKGQPIYLDTLNDKGEKVLQKAIDAHNFYLLGSIYKNYKDEKDAYYLFNVGDPTPHEQLTIEHEKLQSKKWQEHSNETRWFLNGFHNFSYTKPTQIPPKPIKRTFMLSGTGTSEREPTHDNNMRQNLGFPGITVPERDDTSDLQNERRVPPTTEIVPGKITPWIQSGASGLGALLSTGTAMLLVHEGIMPQVITAITGQAVENLALELAVSSIGIGFAGALLATCSYCGIAKFHENRAVTALEVATVFGSTFAILSLSTLAISATPLVAVDFAVLIQASVIVLSAGIQLGITYGINEAKIGAPL